MKSRVCSYTVTKNDSCNRTDAAMQVTLPLKVVRDFTRKVHPTPLGQRTPPVS